MKYLQKSLGASESDTLRITLSVYEPKLSPEPCCDFCGSEHPATMFAAEIMSTGEKRRSWRWLACAECTTAINADDWDIVKERMVRNLAMMTRAQYPTRMLQTAVTRSLDEFHKLVVRLEDLPQ
jgi:hypothetical protein